MICKAQKALEVGAKEELNNSFPIMPNQWLQNTTAATEEPECMVANKEAYENRSKLS